MRKTGTFRTKLWLYFVMFSVIIMAMLWALQTVFFQSLYNRMLAKNTRAAAEEISDAAVRDDLGDVRGNDGKLQAGHFHQLFAAGRG